MVTALLAILIGVGLFFHTPKSISSDKPRVDNSDILSGGPPKDGIPAIDQPVFDTAKSTPFKDDEWVLGLVIDGEARAYPYSILNWHEIVNDRIKDTPVSVTFCPLCDTGIAFESKVGGKETTFGVSGKLYQSCLVMYDRATQTLWAQPWGTGIRGEKTNNNLKRIPMVKTTLGNWKQKYPNTKILSTKTGYSRDYTSSPYSGYATNSQLYFPVRNVETVKGHVKELVTIVWEDDGTSPQNRFGGESIQFVNSEVWNKKTVTGTLGEKTVQAVWDMNFHNVRVYEVDSEGKRGKELPTTSSFAFVYSAFYK